MHKGRLEAFSDGVLAIIITIMVLELKIPHESEAWDTKSKISVTLYTLAIPLAFLHSWCDYVVSA